MTDPTARFSLAGRTALVTGASSGLGRHFAGVLAGAGADVVLAARRTDRLEALAAEIAAAGGRAMTNTLDVSDPAQMDPLLDAVETRFGPVDLLVNNAGISVEGDALALTDDDLDRIIDVNVKAIWHLSTRVARRLVAAGRPGSIVNIASVLAFGTTPTLSLYATSKAAVVQMTRALATDLWPRGIRVNAICPGYFRTEMNEAFFASDKGERMLRRIPPRRLGAYHELDGPLLLLASDAGSFITGAAIPVDGGHAARIA